MAGLLPVLVTLPQPSRGTLVFCETLCGSSILFGFIGGLCPNSPTNPQCDTYLLATRQFVAEDIAKRRADRSVTSAEAAYLISLLHTVVNQALWSLSPLSAHPEINRKLNVLWKAGIVTTTATTGTTTLTATTTTTGTTTLTVSSTTTTGTTTLTATTTTTGTTTLTTTTTTGTLTTITTSHTTTFTGRTNTTTHTDTTTGTLTTTFAIVNGSAIHEDHFVWNQKYRAPHVNAQFEFVDDDDFGRVIHFTACRGWGDAFTRAKFECNRASPCHVSFYVKGSVHQGFATRPDISSELGKPPDHVWTMCAGGFGCSWGAWWPRPPSRYGVGPLWAPRWTQIAYEYDGVYGDGREERESHLMFEAPEVFDGQRSLAEKCKESFVADVRINGKTIGADDRRLLAYADDGDEYQAEL